MTICSITYSAVCTERSRGSFFFQDLLILNLDQESQAQSHRLPALTGELEALIQPKSDVISLGTDTAQYRTAMSLQDGAVTVNKTPVHSRLHCPPPSACGSNFEGVHSLMQRDTEQTGKNSNRDSGITHCLIHRQGEAVLSFAFKA